MSSHITSLHKDDICPCSWFHCSSHTVQGSNTALMWQAMSTISAIVHVVHVQVIKNVVLTCYKVCYKHLKNNTYQRIRITTRKKKFLITWRPVTWITWLHDLLTTISEKLKWFLSNGILKYICNYGLCVNAWISQ